MQQIHLCGLRRRCLRWLIGKWTSVKSVACVTGVEAQHRSDAVLLEFNTYTSMRGETQIHTSFRGGFKQKILSRTQQRSGSRWFILFCYFQGERIIMRMKQLCWMTTFILKLENLQFELFKSFLQSRRYGCVKK